MDDTGWKRPDATNTLTIPLRDNGDGDSGTECKEFDQNEIESDYQVIKKALVGMTRVVQDAMKCAVVQDEDVSSEVHTDTVNTTDFVNEINDTLNKSLQMDDLNPLIGVLKELGPKQADTINNNVPIIKAEVAASQDEASLNNLDSAPRIEDDISSKQLVPHIIEESRQITARNDSMSWIEDNTSSTPPHWGKTDAISCEESSPANRSLHVQEDDKFRWNSTIKDILADLSLVDWIDMSHSPGGTEEETIIDAPEEFRSAEDVSRCDGGELTMVDAASCDPDNDVAETGDTCGLAEKHNTSVLTAQNDICESLKTHTKTSADDQQTPPCSESAYKDEENSNVTTVRHVVLTTPPSCASTSTPPKELAVTAEMNNAVAIGQHVHLSTDSGNRSRSVLDEFNYSEVPVDECRAPTLSPQAGSNHTAPGDPGGETAITDDTEHDNEMIPPKTTSETAPDQEFHSSAMKKLENTDCTSLLSNLQTLTKDSESVGAERVPSGASVRTDIPQTPTVEPSIDGGGDRRAQAPGCSPLPAAAECAALTEKERTRCPPGARADDDGGDQNANFCDSEIGECRGGLISGGGDIEGEAESLSSTEGDGGILHSRDLNKRLVEGRSRLKYLEEKLKEAGLTDEKPADKRCVHQQHVEPKQDNKNKEQVVDKSSSSDDESTYYDAKQTLQGDEDEELGEEEDDLVGGGSFCEFDVRQVASFAGYDADDYYVVYDELDDTSEEEDSQLTDRAAMRGDGDRDRLKHNPDHDNLKSLLKKPGRGKDGKKNRVVFNENKNEFFDADYIILIREECDYDDDEDEGVCCCNQHEMVRLACCEPGCNCNLEGYVDGTPQSPKFAPPLEFVDAVTLSPPEGYKDMELGEQQLLALQQMARRNQQATICRECSATHEDEEEDSLSENEITTEQQDKSEKEKTDQSQQTTPTTPPADTEQTNHHYVLETVTMTTVAEQRVLRETQEDERKTKSPSPSLPAGGSPISGILKGGRLWKQQSADNASKGSEAAQNTDSSVTSDEEGTNRRSVRFTEANDTKRDVCDGAPDIHIEEEAKPNDTTEQKPIQNSVSPESTEMMLTFKLGNHVLISNNSLKPNSAVRQLFPCTKPLPAGKEEAVHQYLVTSESLKAFEEAKRSKLPQVIQSEADESIKKAIERNTLRRSLIRYEPRSKKNVQKTDNSLVERIKQLTCDVDEVPQEPDMAARSSPPGEEARNSPEAMNNVVKNHDKSFSPSSSSTTSSNSSSVSSTYKKITDLFGKKEKAPDIQNNELKPVTFGPAPDLGNGGIHPPHDLIRPHCAISKVNSTNEARKQFLSSLAPLTACVAGISGAEEYYYQLNNVGERSSVASSVGTEYSLEDIDEGLRKDDEESKRIAPDVLAGTPSASESGDELAMFVQQDASRIERIKKKYQPDTNNEEDDEHDDYGFNRRPSVRGIKPRFGSTTEILQQMQNQLQPPATTTRINNHISWPYYSESGLTDNKTRNVNQNVYTEDPKARNYPPQYRPTSMIEESMYQNCANMRCGREMPYRGNANHVYQPVVRVGCGDYYQSLPRNRNGRPQSPPPLEVSKNYHQTMVYIPYNHIEGYQPSSLSPNPYYSQNEVCYTRVTNQNQINKRYIDPVYATTQEEPHYQPNMVPLPPKQLIRVSYSNQQTHVVHSRSESPLPGQFSTARSTQTPAATHSTCSYYSVNPRYRPPVGPWQPDQAYPNKMNRHSFPSIGPRYPPPDSDNDSQHAMPLHNGFRPGLELVYPPQKDSVPNSPTKPRFIERGVPEGAASVSPQDSTVAQSTMTSPTSPQNPQQAHPKPLFYSMNV